MVRNSSVDQVLEKAAAESLDVQFREQSAEVSPGSAERQRVAWVGVRWPDPHPVRTDVCGRSLIEEGASAEECAERLLARWDGGS
jgi:hypothetical protein